MAIESVKRSIMHFARTLHFHVTLAPPDINIFSYKLLNFRIAGAATVYNAQSQTSKMSFHPIAGTTTSAFVIYNNINTALLLPQPQDTAITII